MAPSDSHISLQAGPLQSEHLSQLESSKPSAEQVMLVLPRVGACQSDDSENAASLLADGLAGEDYLLKENLAGGALLNREMPALGARVGDRHLVAVIAPREAAREHLEALIARP